jgi:hypothetical protein
MIDHEPYDLPSEQVHDTTGNDALCLSCESRQWRSRRVLLQSMFCLRAGEWCETARAVGGVCGPSGVLHRKRQRANT